MDGQRNSSADTAYIVIYVLSNTNGAIDIKICLAYTINKNGYSQFFCSSKRR